MGTASVVVRGRMGNHLPAFYYCHCICGSSGYAGESVPTTTVGSWNQLGCESPLLAYSTWSDAAVAGIVGHPAGARFVIIYPVAGVAYNPSRILAPFALPILGSFCHRAPAHDFIQQLNG